ncbi:MAG: site-2 protease family protein [Clostridia bacterium]|nr:site-2 protease family protein [Clostridia bacterium]
MSYNLNVILLSALAALIALTVHEFSHGYAAYRLGDPTARNFGRLTLNPLKHLDPFGALCMIFFHFGWAKPVPINPRYFKNPKKGFAITALAGPLSNLILSLLSALAYLLLLNAFDGVGFESEFTYKLAVNFLLFVYCLHTVNLGLAIFNLVPIPPLDGSRILNVILPPKTYFGIMRYERQIYFGLIGWLFLGDIVKSALLSVPMIATNPVLSAVAGIFSLGDMLSYVMAKLSELIFSFWELFPFI